MASRATCTARIASIRWRKSRTKTAPKRPRPRPTRRPRRTRRRAPGSAARSGSMFVNSSVPARPSSMRSFASRRDGIAPPGFRAMVVRHRCRNLDRIFIPDGSRPCRASARFGMEPDRRQARLFGRLSDCHPRASTAVHRERVDRRAAADGAQTGPLARQDAAPLGHRPCREHDRLLDFRARRRIPADHSARCRRRARHNLE